MAGGLMGVGAGRRSDGCLSGVLGVRLSWAGMFCSGGRGVTFYGIFALDVGLGG
jgi:hypothetical protein